MMVLYEIEIVVITEWAAACTEGIVDWLFLPVSASLVVVR